MKYGKIMELLKDKTIVIPMYIYKLLPILEIDADTFIFLMYLSNKGNKIIFDTKLLCEEFYCDIKTLMQYVSVLQEKKLIQIVVSKNEQNVMEEHISLDFFYEKVSMNLIEKINKKEEKSNVFEILERELGKTLTPIEYEIVKAWKERNYSDEIIKEAIKESVYNGATNLRYIDKILYEWAKKNIKTREDVEKNKKNHREKTTNQKLDLFDYDWMEDENEY